MKIEGGEGGEIQGDLKQNVSFSPLPIPVDSELLFSLSLSLSHSFSPLSLCS